jgi:hypothetical protein
MARSPIQTRIAATLAGSALVLSMAACTSTAGTPSAPGTSASTSASTSDTATGTASWTTGKPGCDDAIAAFQDATTNLATKVHDLPSLQTFATDLVGRLHTASAKATDPKIQSAIAKLADDLNALAAAGQSSDVNQVQAQLSALGADGQAVVSACS